MATLIDLKRTLKGGAGSGNWGHAGRPGKRGGSSPGRGGGMASRGEVEWADATANDRSYIPDLSKHAKVGYVKAKNSDATIIADGKKLSVTFLDDVGNTRVYRGTQARSAKKVADTIPFAETSMFDRYEMISRGLELSANESNI